VRTCFNPEFSMRPYLISLIVGLAVGVFYGLLGVRSPAPPAMALLGLFGMLAGEQLVPVVRPHFLKSESGVAGTQAAAQAETAADNGRNDTQSP
jgi:XapX domain-containing protein